jgi:membrane protein DedA with SNARE-associated domain
MEFIHHYQYVGIFCIQALGMLVPIPDAGTLVLVGYLIQKHDLRFGFALVTAFIGNVTGSTIGFWVGRTFGIRILSKHGYRVGLTAKVVKMAQAWFRRLGKWLLLIGYFIPGVRQAMCYLTGSSELEYPIFAFFAYTGSLIWTTTFIFVGKLLGEGWARMFNKWESYLVPLGVIIIIAGLAIYFRQQARQNKTELDG